MSDPTELERDRRMLRDLSRRGFLTSTAAGATAVAADMGHINVLQAEEVTRQLRQQDKPSYFYGLQAEPASLKRGIRNQEQKTVVRFERFPPTQPAFISVNCFRNSLNACSTPPSFDR